MNTIEKIELLETLKAGKPSKIYNKGAIFDKKDGPFPPAIREEIRAHLGKPGRIIKVLMTSADVAQEDARVRAVETAKAEAIAARAAAEAKLIERDKEFLELGSANKRMEAEIEDLTKQLTDLDERHEVLTKQFTDLDDTETSELTKQVDDLTVINAVLVSTNEDLVVQNEVFAENNAALEKEVADLKKEVATLKGEVSELSEAGKKKGGLFSKKG